MAYAEKRGKGPRSWRVRYKLPDGTWGTQPGFETKKAALEWGRAQESAPGRDDPPDTQARDSDDQADEAPGITVDQWIDKWEADQDVGISTAATRKSIIKRLIRPTWGSWQLSDITTAEVSKWEKGLPAAKNIAPRTASDARSLLCTILGDAAAARPPLIGFNPALRPRNRGRKTGRRLLKSPPRIWATPLEALLIAERAALLSGRDDDFIMNICIPYTGMRWGEVIGLEGELCRPGLINVEWQLHEVDGTFYRLPPKDDSYRSANWAPFVPVDLPPFLDSLITAQAAKAHGTKCACASDHGGSGHFLFRGPDGGHHRRSNYARRVFRPACDGRYLPEDGRPGKLVIVDGSTWPGRPVASWPPAEPGQPWQPQHGKDNARLVNDAASTACCPACGRSVRRLASGLLVAHKVKDERCPGSGGPPAEDPALAAWLPVKQALAPHGFRHSHKTWMVEDGIPEILAEARLGHEVPGMRGLYSHVSDRMRQELKDALQARFEESLKVRFELAPHSPVPVLDELLTPFRG